jgi:hypothetical protein
MLPIMEKGCNISELCAGDHNFVRILEKTYAIF